MGIFARVKAARDERGFAAARKRVQGVGKPAALVRTKVVEPSFVVETNSLGFRNRMLLVVATPIGAGAGAGVQLPPTQICFGEKSCHV